MTSIPLDTRPGWTPVLSADHKTYCSPLCGCGCTRANHDEAHRRARDLADRLGPDWEPRVWENGRWHYEARHKQHECIVHPGDRYPDWCHVEGRDEYTVYLNTNPQFIECDVDPRSAVMRALESLRLHTESLLITRHYIITSLQP